MTNIPIQFLQTSSSLSREDSHKNESFPNPYSIPAYPLTPYPIVPETRDCSPSALVTWDNLVHTAEPEANQTHFYAPSASGLCHSSPTPSLSVSPTELQRVLDSLLDQVDWLEVAIKVAKNRAPSVYCNAIEQILLAHIYQLVKAEGEGDDAVGFKSADDEKHSVHVYEGDDEDEDEDSSEFARKSKDEDGNYDGDDHEHLEEDKDEDDDEDEQMDEDESDGDSECDGV